MAFDPSQPFDIVSEPEDQPQDKPAFDPSKPFEVIGEREEDVAGKLETLSKVATDNPDEAARISSLSKKTGAPYDLVKTAPDQFENHVNQPDWKGLSDGAPKTAKYLGEDPERFQQARDDTQALSAIEQHRSTKDWANDLTVRAVQGFSLAGQGAIGLADMAHKADPYARIADYVLGSQSKTLSELLAKNGISFNDANSAADSLVSDASKSESARIADTYKNDGLLAAAKDTVTSPGYLSEKIVQSMPQMLVAMSAVRQRAGQILAEGGEEALKAAMPELAKLSAAIEGSQSAGNYAGGKAETGQLDDKAMVAAGGQGVTTALFGMLSNKIGAKFGIDDVEAAVGSGINYKDGVTGFLRRFLGTTAKEGPIEEGLQSASEQAWSNFGDGKDIGGGVLQAAVEGSIVGAVQGGAVLTGGEAVNAVDRRLSKAAKTEQAATQHINDIKTELAILENSKLAQRSPETMHEYLDHIDGEEKQTVFVDPSQLFNQGGVARADLERIAPSAVAQIDEALDKGGLIEIPKNELLIGLMGKPDIQGNVVQFLKADANADSLHDINTQREGLSQEMYDLASQQIEKSKDATKLTTQRDEIIQHLQDSMSAAGMDDAGNKHRAAMIASGIVSQAIREKVDPVELYKQQVGNISNAELQGGVFNQQNPFTQENGFETVEEIDFSLPEGFTSLDDGSNVKASASESGDQNGQQKFEFDQFGDRKTDPNEKDIQLSNFPKERGWRVYDKAKLLEGIRLASDKIRGELGRTGSSESQATRELTSGPLGPFSSTSVSSEIKGDRLFIYYVGQEQAELGLTDEAALTVILNKTGELVVNGPPADSATFEEFKKLGWADFAEKKDGEKSDFWTSLDGFEGLDGAKGLLNPGTAAMLADAHARLRAWRGEDKVLINWVRHTGATGNALNGRKGVAFFQSQIKNQTETPAFKKWFGDSKVVDADGKPLVVYHGTKGKDFSVFKPSNAEAYGDGIYFASNQEMPKGEFGADGRVIEAYVKIDNPSDGFAPDGIEQMIAWRNFKKTNPEFFGDAFEAFDNYSDFRAATIREAGYDGIIAENDEYGLEIVAFRPEQIKSATDNNGAFDSSNPDIRFRRDAGAGMKPVQVRVIVNNIAAKWKNAPQVIIADTVEGLPFKAPSDAAGAFHNGKVYLVASNLRDRNHAEFVLLHEALGHYGLSGVLGNQIKPAMRTIYQQNRSVRDLADKYLKENDGASIELAVEEVLSDLAGAKLQKLNGFQRLVAAVRNAVRALGFKLELSDNDVLNLMGKAREFAEKGTAMEGAYSEAKLSRAAQTDTPAFKKWFGDSKIVGADGKPLVVYHGTPYNFSSFKNTGANKDGLVTADGEEAYFFTTSKSEADRYAKEHRHTGKRGSNGGNILPAYLKAEKLANITNDGWNLGAHTDEIADLINNVNPSAVASRLKELGYDGFVYDGEISPGVAVDGLHYVVFSPNQIKSATDNNGDFDPNDPSILMQNEPAPRGTFNPITREIGLTNAADLSTFLHESGHLFLEITADLAARESASESVKKDMDTALQWFGISGESFEDRMAAWNKMTLDEKRPYHEKWAESFEQYLFEGKAPSMELRDAFRNFRQWLTHVYKSLSQFVGTHDGAKLNDEMRSVFDRMLATEEQIAEMEAARGMLPLFSKKPSGMTESEWTSYRQAADEATQSAVEQLTSRSLRDMKWLANAKNKAIRKLQREAADERRVARMEARQQVLSQPVYRAWQFLKAPIEGSKAANKKAKQSEGVDSKRDSLFAAIAKLGGLNREEMMAQMGYGAKDFAAWKSGIFSKPVVRKDGGLSLDAMSEALSQHNYLTVDEHGKVEIGDLLDKAMEEMRSNKQYSTDADYDVLLGDTQYAATPDAEQVDFVGGRLSRQAIREMYDDADLANMQGEKVDTAGKLMQEEKYKPDLFVAHNLTAENLVHSDELGGLAAPSLGVSRTTTGGFTGFGEITLLADKSILTDRDARTFDADVYSPRHPRAQESISYGNYIDLVQRIKASQGEVEGLEFRVDHDSLMRNGAQDLANSEAFQNYYLVSKGIIVKPKKAKAAPAILKAIKYLRKNAKHDSAYESYNLRGEDWFKALAEDHYKADFEKWKSLRDDFTPAELVKYGPFEEDGSLKYQLYDSLAREVEHYHKKGGQDSAATRGAIAKHFRTDKGSAELQEFANAELEKISSGKQLVKYTKNGNQKRSAYTLDNIVAEMTRELQGGEGFNYGAGSVRSAFAFEFKHNTIESIKSFKGGIVSKEEMNKVRDEANDKLGDALDKLRKFYKYDSSSFGYSNDASSAIAEGQKGQAEAFRMTAESKAIIKELTTYLRELPSEYFETKMQRAVGIGEFKAAIVPKGTDQKVLDILARNGISKIDFYDPKKPGARTKAISKQDGLLFQPGRDKQQMLKDTDMATSDDYGVRFETGVPVTFNFLHNKESATKLYGKPKKDSQWNRGYEPAGRFMIQVSKAELPSYGKFDTGSITFKNPIVIENDSLEWKKKLSSLYGGKTGKRLSVAIIDDGFDGIVTVDKGHTSEIVDLTTFDYKKALYQIGEEKDANDKRTLESLGVMSDEGLHPDTVADLFGLSSGDELVRKLLTMPDPVSEIERLTDEIMLQRHSDLATPEGRERAAEAAIHNEARAKFIATELAMLNRAIGKPRMIMAAAKEYAGQIVSALRVRDLKTGQYDAAEAKASKEADKALRDGNIAAAALAKRNQVLHNMTAKMVRDAQDEVEKAVRYLKKFDKPNKKIDIDYQEQIDTLLERYDLRQKTLKAIERSQNLAQWIEQQKAEGLEPVIPDYLQDEAKRTNYKMLTVEELRGLVDAVKNIEHLGRLKNRLLTDKAKRELNALADGIGKSIADNGGDVKPSKLERNTAVDRLSDLASGFFSMHRKLASIVRQLDGWKDGGILWDAMIRPMNEAGDAEAVMHEKSTMALAEVFAYLKGKKLTKKLYIPMIATSLSHEGRLAVALNWGNEGNRQRLMDGDKWGVGEVNAILATLTAEDWKFVQGVWDHIATYKDEIGEQQRRLTGVEPSWVDATPFEIRTADGQTVQVQGGYYPAKYDTTRSTQALSNEAAGNVFDQWKSAKGQGKTRDGFTKSRATQVKDRPIRKDFGVITQHITEVTHRLAWQDWVVDMNRLLKKEQVDSSIRAHYGNEILEEMRKAIEDITTGDMTAQSSFEKAINHLRIGTTIVGLGYNLTTSLLQPFGLTQSMVRIGPKWVAKGLSTWIGNPARMNARTEEVYAKSDFMRLRGKTMMREMNEILNSVRKEKMSKIEASYFYGIQKMQIIADMPTWLGQYEKSMAEFDGDESKAIALADQAVLDAQGGGQNKDLARIQRGGPLLKLWTNFYSYFNTTYNLTREVAGRTDVKDPASVAKSAVDMLLLYTIPSVMVSLLKGAIIGDDDEDELADRLWRDQLGYLFGSMVGLREISAAFSGFNGYSGPAGTRFFSEIARLGKQAEQGEADAPFLKSLNNVGGILFHYPAGQINRTIEGANALMDGETDSPAALIFGKPK